MRCTFRQTNPFICRFIEHSNLKPSYITVIEGTSVLVPEVLFELCAKIACKGRDVMLVDGANSFNPYAISRAVKFMGFEPRSALLRIHVARAFTEYQMDAIISSVRESVIQCNSSFLGILYLSNLFSTQDGKKLFDSTLKSLKQITQSLGLVTVVTSFGGIWWGDTMVAENADRVIRIHETKTVIKVQDGNNVFEYVTLPPGQTTFIDFIGGEMNGQNCAKLQGCS